MRIGKKKQKQGKYFSGEWHIPGETIEGEETDEIALIRGMKEETGLEIRVGAYLASHKSSTRKDVRWYECFASACNAVPGSDLERIMWVDKKHVPIMCGEKTTKLWPDEIKLYFNL